MTNLESLCWREPLPRWAPSGIRRLRVIARLTRVLERRRWERARAEARDQMSRLMNIDHRFENDIFFD